VFQHKVWLELDRLSDASRLSEICLKNKEESGTPITKDVGERIFGLKIN